METCRGSNYYYHLQIEKSRDDQHRHPRLYQSGHEVEDLLSRKQEEDWKFVGSFVNHRLAVFSLDLEAEHGAHESNTVYIPTPQRRLLSLYIHCHIYFLNVHTENKTMHNQRWWSWYDHSNLYKNSIPHFQAIFQHILSFEQHSN